MTISAFPTPTPDRTQDPEVFDPAMSAFLAHFPTFVTEANAVAVAMNLNDTTDTSTSSVLIGLGAKTFTVTAGKSFQPGMYLVVADVAAPSTNSMAVQVTSYSGVTLVVDSKAVRGSGTIASWVISLSAAPADIAQDINAATAKATPIDADKFGYWDSVSGLLRSMTWANVKTLLALVAGSASQVFSVAPATAAEHAASAAQIQVQALTAFTTAGTSTAYTVATTPAITAYAIGQELDLVFDKACGASPTINRDGLGAVNLVDRLVDGTYYNIPFGRIPINLRSKCVMVSLTQMFVRDTPCEYFVSTVLSSSPISLTSLTAASITSISVPPGDWDISGHVSFNTTATTNVYSTSASIASSITLSIDAISFARNNYFGSALNTPGNGAPTSTPNSSRFSFATATTIYLVASAYFITSTMTAYGSITATRAKA